VFQEIEKMIMKREMDIRDMDLGDGVVDHVNMNREGLSPRETGDNCLLSHMSRIC
jgi:hypothetical protein